MTIRQTLAAAARRLEAAGVPDAQYDAQAMLAHVLGEDMLGMRIEGGREVSAEAFARYEAMLSRRAVREPMQYILGETSFMGLDFRVAPGVLIPRQDTEILCEEALRRLGITGERVLDIGTGSGALAIAIALFAVTAQVTAVDVSDQALDLAQQNAQRLGANVRFLKSDCFDAVAQERFDMIVSNPPYISGEEMKTLMPEVRMEPELALYGGEDGLTFYRRITREAGRHLTPGGWLLFEIGWQQKDAVEALMREHVGEPFALRDYGGNWRVVGAQLRADEGARGEDARAGET